MGLNIDTDDRERGGMTEDRWMDLVLKKLDDLDGKLDGVARIVAAQEAGASDRQRQLNELKICTEKLVETVSGHTLRQAAVDVALLENKRLIETVQVHGKLIDRHEQKINILWGGMIAIALPVVGAIIKVLIDLIGIGP